MSDRRIIYFASELAGCVGMNRFTEPWQAAVKIYQRVAPSDYAAVVASLPANAKYKPEPTNSETEMLLAEKGCLESARHAVECPQAELQDRLSAVLQDDLKEVDEVVKKYVYTARGNRAEGPALDVYEKITGCQVVERNSKFRVSKVRQHGGGHLLIGGKVDGLTDAGELIEIKNRQRRLLDFVPLHERVQVHAYMALTAKKKCTLVQTCGEANRSTIVNWDDGLWDNVCAKLSTFHDKMVDLLASREKQANLLRESTF